MRVRSTNILEWGVNIGKVRTAKQTCNIWIYVEYQLKITKETFKYRLKLWNGQGTNYNLLACDREIT